MYCKICSEELIENLDVLTKFRYYKYSYEVTPTGRHALTYDEESWKPKPDDQNPTKSKESAPEEIGRASETRQSKTKRVKNYLKKCKHALGSRSSSSTTSSEPSSSNQTSWFVDDKLEKTLNEGEIHELDDIFEKVHINANTKNVCSSGNCQAVDIIDVNLCDDENSRVECDLLDDQKSLAPEEVYDSSPILNPTQEQVDEEKEVEKETTEIKGEVASLVDRYFGELYENYKNSRKCLVRQARDLLVCEYRGSLQRFETEFCIPGAKLLQNLKDKNVDPTEKSAPSGWPLCLGSCGVIIQLGSFSPTSVRNGDCYVCLKSRSAPGIELAIIWRKFGEIHCRTLSEFRDPLKNFDEIMCSPLTSVMDLENATLADSDASDLPELLQNLLVSVERAIERVPLDDLASPCPQCFQYLPLNRQEQESDKTTCSCQCSCRMPENVVLKKDMSMQTSPMFEFAGPIPHIDSDEDEDKDPIKSSSFGKKPFNEVATAKRITDIPEKLLMSGINLPGTVDTEGRPIILCYAECVARAGLNKYEIAKVLLYYASIPCANEKTKGFAIFLLAETDEHKALDSLDKSIALITNQMNVTKFIIWKPNASSEPRNLNASRLKGAVVSDESSLEPHVAKDQAPASCGGSCTHDQLEWVEFFKQLEPFLASCHSAGRSLLSALTQLRKEEIPLQVNRRFLNHQYRQISKVLQTDNVLNLRRDGSAILQSLEERTQWILASRDVRRQANFARSSFTAVDRVAKRLEELAVERKERLKELARLRTLEEEAGELLAWIRRVGDETIRTHAILLRTIGDVRSVKDIEKDFEKFYFDAMRQIDKAGDLVEESNKIPEFRGKNLKENANNLKIQMKIFAERLEETRENLEDCSRCLQHLEASTNVEKRAEQIENLEKVALKTGNEKVMEICKMIQMRDDQLEVANSAKEEESVAYAHTEVSATSTPIKPAMGQQVRRRSLSSIAFIYKCNHYAAGVPCNCHESDTENSVSYKLKKKYMQSFQNCACSLVQNNSGNNTKEAIDRKNSLTLDGIKEVRESVENLLEKTDSGLSGCGRCDSGVSTADNSVGDDSVYKKKLQRTCSCQFYNESCALCSAGSSSTGSTQDHTENQQDSITEEGSDGFGKSGSDDIEEEQFSDERRKVPPVPANSHLHCHVSNLHLPADFLDSNTDPKTQKTLLYIMREMIHTEQDYVKSLDYIIENYIPELMREDIPQALRGQRNVIFGNVEKIYEFHSQHFLRELEQCENSPLQIGQIFLKHDKKFYLYALYNKNKPKSDSLMSEYGSIFFKSKQMQLGDKMDLASYLLKPVQRMGKYALLLQQMMKACPKLPEGASERAIAEQDDLKQAEEMVRFQLRHGNDLLAMDSIRDCDVNLKEQGRLIRQNEFLVWEGRTGKKTLRQVFLFEDLILFSKARRFPDRKNLDLFIYKSSIKLTDIGLTAKIGDSSTKFEIWFRKRKPNDTFTIQSTSEDIKKAWTEELSQLLWKQAIKNREVRMVEMSSMGIGNKPCLDIRPSKDQISDRSISFAQLSRTAPRFRNSIAGPVTDLCRSAKRPHSIISLSSISSSSTSSGGSLGCGVTTPTSVTLPCFESVCGSPKACRRSGTLNSQCSTESGIIADISLGGEDCSNENTTHWPLEKSSSHHSSASSSTKSNTTIPTQSDDTQVTVYHVPDELPVNI